MKKVSDTLRLKRVIESDRMIFTTEILELISSDLKTVLKEYFHIVENPTIEIKKTDELYEIKILTKADTLRALQKVI